MVSIPVGSTERIRRAEAAYISLSFEVSVNGTSSLLSHTILYIFESLEARVNDMGQLACAGA